MMTQLRMDTSNKRKMDAFVRAWKAGVYPLNPDPAQFIAHAEQWFLTDVVPRR